MNSFLGTRLYVEGNFRECMGVFWVTNGASGWVLLKKRSKKKNVRVINRTGGGDGVAGGNSHQE